MDFQALLDQAKTLYKARTVINVQQFHEICKGVRFGCCIPRVCLAVDRFVTLSLCLRSAAGLDKLVGGAAPEAPPEEAKEGGDEDGKAPEPVEAAPAEYSNNAAPLFSVLGASVTSPCRTCISSLSNICFECLYADIWGKGAADVSSLLSVLAIIKQGYGEGTVKSCVHPTAFLSGCLVISLHFLCVSLQRPVRFRPRWRGELMFVIS